MAPEKEFIVYKSPKGKLYTKRASAEDLDGQVLFTGSHEDCMNYLYVTPEQITPVMSKRKKRAQTQQKIAKMILGLQVDELEKVGDFIQKLKLNRS